MYSTCVVGELILSHACTIFFKPKTAARYNRVYISISLEDTYNYLPKIKTCLSLFPSNTFWQDFFLSYLYICFNQGSRHTCYSNTPSCRTIIPHVLTKTLNVPSHFFLFSLQDKGSKADLRGCDLWCSTPLCVREFFAWSGLRSWLVLQNLKRYCVSSRFWCSCAVKSSTSGYFMSIILGPSLR